MSKNKKRLDRLERSTGGGDDTVIGFSWNDGFVTVKGERITQEEFDRRYPNAKRINFDWIDDDSDSVELVPAH